MRMKVNLSLSENYGKKLTINKASMGETCSHHSSLIIICNTIGTIGLATEFRAGTRGKRNKLCTLRVGIQATPAAA
jgi:hypothetical protein